MAMAVGSTAEGEPLSEINTTPLIDVMLVLLIMLIVTLPPQRHAVKLDTPTPPPPDAPPPPEDNPDPVRLFVDFDGSIFWNGAVIDDASLQRDLAIEAQREKQPEIHIEPHRLAKYGVVAHVMASAQREGLTKLGVIGGT
ncbi:MAG TPA: biopolymer transporter ExbD [Hyphomonadaceae bacterium]|jgi:biopolymer transport protein ExbD